eukprot:TRINITY_DN7200_c0_g1_i5.p1 TRINITY_DN7200_c0_g1~~TRINITY_DN7200_c0_g1_i5.p1  ORF type:complete len:370 (-),score=-25.40 TRINITY_DN7200_c0_g1_i5:569-1678(-)
MTSSFSCQIARWKFQVHVCKFEKIILSQRSSFYMCDQIFVSVFLLTQQMSFQFFFFNRYIQSQLVQQLYRVVIRILSKQTWINYFVLRDCTKNQKTVDCLSSTMLNCKISKILCLKNQLANIFLWSNHARFSAKTKVQLKALVVIEKVFHQQYKFWFLNLLKEYIQMCVLEFRYNNNKSSTTKYTFLRKQQIFNMIFLVMRSFTFCASSSTNKQQTNSFADSTQYFSADFKFQIEGIERFYWYSIITDVLLMCYTSKSVVVPSLQMSCFVVFFFFFASKILGLTILLQLKNVYQNFQRSNSAVFCAVRNKLSYFVLSYQCQYYITKLFCNFQNTVFSIIIPPGNYVFNVQNTFKKSQFLHQNFIFQVNH